MVQYMWMGREEDSFGFDRWLFPLEQKIRWEDISETQKVEECPP